MVGSLVYAEARRRGVEGTGRMIVLGDGAPWIWNLAAEHFPHATQVVDLYHAREHLVALSHLGPPIPDQPAWLAARLAELDHGDIEVLVGAVAALPGSDASAVPKALAYFETNRERMRYSRFRQLGLFVGSGAIEAGCKAVIHQRLKLSGLRWSRGGAAAVISLRCHSASGRLEEDIWKWLHSQKIST